MTSARTAFSICHVHLRVCRRRYSPPLSSPADYGRQTRPELLLDIGADGEIALCHDGRLLCCSTAAGPALEGAGIYMGMTALPGAIDHVYLTGGKITYATIGGAEAKGICGSGILDAAAVLLDAGMLDEAGVILAEDHDFLDMITEKDDQPAVAIGPVILTQKEYPRHSAC